MAFATSSTTNVFEATPKPATQLFARCQDGDVQALNKLVLRRDFILSGTSTGDTTGVWNLSLTELGLAAGDYCVVKARVWGLNATVAGSQYGESSVMVANIAGTLTIVGAGASQIHFEGTDGLPPTFTVSSPNLVLTVDSGSAVAVAWLGEIEVIKLP